VAERRVFITGYVAVYVLTVRRRINDDLFLAVALQRPRRVGLIEWTKECRDEVHGSCTQEDEYDIANQPGSNQVRHPALYPRYRA